MENINKDDKKVDCMGGCGTQLAADHTGIKCESSCNYCKQCSVNYANSLLTENVFPFKCQCKAKIVLGTLERQLNEEQLKMQYDAVMVGILFEDEFKMDCPHCIFFEIWTPAVQDNFFQCKNEKCFKVCCSVCKSELPKLKENYYQDKNIMKQVEEFKMESYEYHQKCKELEGLFKEFNVAYELGITRKCPECGLNGHKNEACNKMICPRCNTVWCYICELSEDKVDKQVKKEGQFYTHFDNWKTNKKRCPMQLEDLAEVDVRYKNTDNCLQLFHQINLSNKLKLFVKKIGQNKQKTLHSHFRAVANCGFTLQDLQKNTVNLINYK